MTMTDLTNELQRPDYTEAITESQAQDLANYFLGPHWCAVLNENPAIRCELTRATPAALQDITTHTAKTWDEVFKRAGVKLPGRPHFVAVGYQVKRGAETVAHTHSKTFAKRIALALEAYVPSLKGF